MVTVALVVTAVHVEKNNSTLYTKIRWLNRVTLFFFRTLAGSPQVFEN